MAFALAAVVALQAVRRAGHSARLAAENASLRRRCRRLSTRVRDLRRHRDDVSRACRLLDRELRSINAELVGRRGGGAPRPW